MDAFDGLAEALLAAARRVNEAADGVALAFGEVIPGQGLAVRLESRLILPADVLILTDPVIAAAEPVLNEDGGPTGAFRVTSKLQAGDRVLLAKMQGGQYWVVLSKCYPTESD